MDGRIREFNDAFAGMLGYSPDELCRLTCNDVTPPKWHAMEEDIIEDQVRARGYSDLYEKEYRRKDGTVFPVELRTILQRDDKGKIVGMWGIVRDIASRKRTEKALLESYDRLQRAFGGIISAITTIIETRDPYTAGHQRRVSMLAVAIALEMGLSEESVNGEGYPNHLAGDGILPEAMIVAVADVVEAMSFYRPYRGAISMDVALDEIIKGKGTLYDPESVDACVKLIREKHFSFETDPGHMEPAAV